MSRRTFMIIIHVDVHDEDALREAAEQRYMEDNASPPGTLSVDALARREKQIIDEWHIMRETNGPGEVAADIQMLFDPAVSPPGCEINDSVVEEITAGGDR